MQTDLELLIALLIAYLGMVLLSGIMSRVVYFLLHRYWQTDKLDPSNNPIPFSVILSISAIILAIILGAVLYLEMGESLGMSDETLNDAITVFIALPIIFLIIWHEIVEPFGSALLNWLKNRQESNK